MKFRTEIELSASKFRINHESRLLMLGSCFTDNIGSWLEDLLFPVIINPFGVVYNPVSLKSCLEILIQNRQFNEEDLFFFNKRYQSWYHHSSFTGEDKEEVLKRINRNTGEGHELLKNAEYLIITFGTARVYRYLKTGQIVSNCHKVPQKEFSHELLEAGFIIDAYADLMATLKDFNPRLKYIFTISPVRHWKDGAHGNQLSKSILHVALNGILSQKSSQSDYFPSYELLLDDLRDYRFYSRDLLHPNESAIEYVREKFAQRYFDPGSDQILKKINELTNALHHRDLSGGSPEYHQFLEKQLQKIRELKRTTSIPGLDSLAEKFANKLSGI